MNDRIYISIDVETTGLQSGVDEIIEVAAVKFRGREVLETYQQLVRPRQSLPLKITRLTGITPEHLADMPRFVQIGADLARFIKSYPLVGHSVSFDIGMLRAQGMSFSQPAYDTFDLATLLMPQLPAYKLGSLADKLGIPHPDDHRALNDALVTAQVFAHLLERIAELDMGTLSEIQRITARVDWPARALFEEALRERAKNIFAETRTTSTTDGQEEGLFDSAQFSTEPVPLKPTGSSQPIDPGAIKAFFAVDGPMGQAFEGYEQREPQVEMASAVADALNEGKILMVEAGTGTGKSMAYLMPSVLHAVTRGERVVISTNTINLQDQLFFKDIPDLQRIMTAGQRATTDDRSSTEQSSPSSVVNGQSSNTPFTAALLKGRGNYLCLKRYDEVRRSESLNADEVRTLLKVQLWLPTTKSGDKAELLLMDKENTAWGRLNATPDTCVGPRCSYFRDCHFFNARRKADSAHIVVVNHALLLADLNAQANVLPAYDHLIIDEAHNLEDVATDQLSFSVDQAAILKFLDDLYLEGGVRGAVSGLLSELPSYLQGTGEQKAIETVQQVAEQLAPTLRRARLAVYDCFNALTDFVLREAETNQYDTRLRLTPGVRNRPVWQDIQVRWQNLSDMFQSISEGLGKAEGVLQELEEFDIPGYDELRLRVEWLRRFATDVRVNTGHIIFGNEASICWLTHDRNSDTLSLTAAPLSVAELLKAGLFNQKKTSVLASATLSIQNGFSFIRDRLGVENPAELHLESPFDYEKQALIYIPNDIPEPNQRGYQQMVEDALIGLCTATGGRTLALFTANSTLRQTYAGIQDALEEQEIAVLGQGIDGSRRAVLERFKEFPRTVLLGTNSFWEGVDVVGDALSVLVIAKLPFSVPNDPIFAARSELFADPFGEYSVPQSILRFKQGFGRLIRSKEDRGIVVVLDKRLLTKKYGQQFLESLPHTRVRTGPLKQLPLLAARFLV
jgi:DNA polymerase III epsilon subunit family exonuclease